MLPHNKQTPLAAAALGIADESSEGAAVRRNSRSDIRSSHQTGWCLLLTVKASRKRCISLQNLARHSMGMECSLVYENGFLAQKVVGHRVSVS